ncbi:hypothetical protein IF2G_00392 [Cordyceps javanica]|nr:hypothetical protein IF2G_00392 [Cordyceps javanica]
MREPGLGERESQREEPMVFLICPRRIYIVMFSLLAILPIIVRAGTALRMALRRLFICGHCSLVRSCVQAVAIIFDFHREELYCILARSKCVLVLLRVHRHAEGPSLRVAYNFDGQRLTFLICIIVWPR